MNNEEAKLIINVPEMPSGNIPVLHAARILGKDQQFIREAMKRGLIDLGLCFKKENSNQYDFYISPKKLWELTGYVYQGYEKEQELLEVSKKKSK